MATLKTASQYKVQGLEQTLKELRKVDAEYVKAFRKQARKHASETVKSAKDELQHQREGWRETNYPLARMDNSILDKRRGAGFKFNWRKVRAGIKFKLGGPKKTARTKKTFRMFSIIQADGPGAMYDMAGRRNQNPSKVFEDNLENIVDRPHRRSEPGRDNRGPSRYMYPGVWFYLPQLEDRMLGLVEDLERRVNKRLIKRPKA